MKFRLPFFSNRLKPPEKAPSTAAEFLGRCLLPDIEVQGDPIVHVGAILGEKSFERNGPFKTAEALSELEDFPEVAAEGLAHSRGSRSRRASP